MIKVYKSDVGQYVLVHGPSQSFIIDDDLASGYARLEAHVREEHPEWAQSILEAQDITDKRTSRDGSRFPVLLLVVVLALLPFVWLLVMHHSMATLLSEIRLDLRSGYGVSVESHDTMREDIEVLYLEQNRLRQSVYQLRQQVEALLQEQAPDGMEGETGAEETAEEEGAPLEGEVPVDPPSEPS